MYKVKLLHTISLTIKTYNPVILAKAGIHLRV